jgi:hypothetical protein
MEMEWLVHLMERLGLTLHPEKTRVVPVSDGWVNFLRYKVGRRSRDLIAFDIADPRLDRLLASPAEKTASAPPCCRPASGSPSA